MKLVILDGATLHDSDTMKEIFAEFGDVTAYDRTKPSEVLTRMGDCDMVLTNKVILTNDMLAKCPNLHYVGVMATGYNVIDTAYAAQKGITVTNIPSYSTPAVVQHVFALMFALVSHVHENAQAVQDGAWCACPDFSFLAAPIYELAGKTLGVIGMGTIGTWVSRVASAFGMKVLAYSRHSKEMDIPNLTWCDERTLFQESDFVTVHTPLNEQTEHLINQDTLKLMKKTAYVINTARGPIVCEEDLKEALNRGQIAGAAVDVLSVEPPKEDNPLLTSKNIIITPHVAWATQEAKNRLLDICLQNIRAFLSGTPQNKVN